MRQAALSARAIVVLACSALASAAFPQHQEADAGAVFPTRSQAVTVDVVVLDAQGRPVKDLTREDFVVKEDGTPRDLVAFRAVTPSGSGPMPTKGQPTSVATNDDARPERGRIFLVVFDDVHLAPIEGERARTALDKFLDTSVHAGDHVTLLATSGGVRRSARLPEGLTDLHAWVAGRKGLRMPDDPRGRISQWEAYEVHVRHNDGLAAEIARRLREVGLIADNMDPDQGLAALQLRGNGGDTKIALVRAHAALGYASATSQARAALGSLRDALESLSVVEGRKTVLFISEGFFRDPDETLYATVTDAARHANAAVDFLDARALTGLPDNTSIEMERMTDPRDHAVYYRDLHDAEGTESVALDTGGFIVHGVRYMGDGLERAARESESYYLLGYEPAWTRADGKFHKIEVEVARPGVKVQARRGYHAAAPGPATGGLHPDVQHALDSPLEAAGVPLRLASYVLGPTDGGKSLVVLAGAADGAQLGWEEAAGRFADGLETVFRVMPAGGGEPADKERRLDLKLRREEHATVLAEGVPLLADFDLAPGRYLARLVVRDETTGRLGSVLQEIEVPDAGFRLSTPILTDMIHTNSGAEPTPIPLARRSFKAGTKLYCSFQVLGVAASPAGRPPRVTFEVAAFHADGSVLARGPSQLLAPGPKGELGRMLAVSLDKATPGEYQLVLRARDDDTGQVAEHQERFTVVGGGTAAASRPTYRDLVAAYGRGETMAAASGLQALGPERVREEARGLRASASCDARCVEAAALMHTDAAVAAAGQGGDVDLQLSLARDLLGGLPDGPERRAWERDWFLAAGYFLEGQARFPEAQRIFGDAARSSRDDAQVLLAQGTVVEALSLLPDLAPRAPEAYPAGSLMLKELVDRSVTDRYEAQALTLYERALAREPGLLEAQLRRGRIRGLHGRASESAADLAAVAHGATEPYLRSLASLFLGDLEQRRGRLEAAAENYRSALAALPHFQTASVALSQALRRLGRTEAAAQAIEQGLAGADETEDPWVGYYLGLAWRRDAALEGLKRRLGQ